MSQEIKVDLIYNTEFEASLVSIRSCFFSAFFKKGLVCKPPKNVKCQW